MDARAPTFPSKKTPGPVVDFTNCIKRLKEKAEYQGTNGLGETAPFIPRQELADYWRKQSKINEVCKAYNPPLAINFETIQHHYLIVFSILVYADRAEFINVFIINGLSDATLPFKGVPATLDGPVYTELFALVMKHQWLFCPLVIDPSQLANSELEIKHILPFHELKRLSFDEDQSIVSDIYTFQIQDRCNKIREVSVFSCYPFYKGARSPFLQ